MDGKAEVKKRLKWIAGLNINRITDPAFPTKI
jgi:hypothetical protein